MTSVSDGIVRIHGLADVMQGEMIEMPGNTFALALNLERDSVGAVVLGDYEAPARRRQRQDHRPHPRSAGRPELLGRVVDALGNPIDGKGPINAQADRADREGRAGRDLAQVGVAAGADGLQVGRRDDPGWPRPARADHRRPPDRQDRARDRHDHQPEGFGHQVHLRRDRPEASSIANVVRRLEENGALAHTIIVAASASESAAMQYIAPTPAARWASTSATAVKTR
jgi:F-type H+-transporting ATPase subunit alpha